MYNITVEPKVEAIPFFEIKLNGRVVACARDSYSATLTAMAVEFQEAAKLSAKLDAIR